IAIDEVLIAVGQHGAAETPPRREREEQRSAAHEWLVVRGNLCRRVLEQLGEQLALAARPLQERRRLARRERVTTVLRNSQRRHQCFRVISQLMVRLNRIYTKAGDGGQTRLVGGQKVGKDSLRLESYGTVDELSACIGLARTALESAGAPAG